MLRILNIYIPPRLVKTILLSLLVVFLLSDAAAWMTGSVIPVDGGMLAT